MKKLCLTLIVVLIALLGCQAQPEPEEIVADMTEAVNAGDVDATMACFADDAVVKLVPALPPGSPGTYTGAEEIRSWFEELVAGNFEIEMDVVDVEGDTVTTKTSTWMDETRELGIAPLVATETYTVREGKIRGFTWAISEESLAQVQEALEPTMTVVFEGDACSYDGPSTIPAGKFEINWKIVGQPREGYGLAILTLDEDKTIEDLDAWSSMDQPPWSRLIGLREYIPEYEYIPKSSAHASNGPIFLACFTRYPEAMVGALGPIDVEE